MGYEILTDEVGKFLTSLNVEIQKSVYQSNAYRARVSVPDIILSPFLSLSLSLLSLSYLSLSLFQGKK